ncbi:MAG: TetR/AcrR family transcriptional regulator [Cellvibrionales bacterium]|nr:TetR/AcrR family transcriptional regulator [Cellvibrionales bacterium]
METLSTQHGLSRSELKCQAILAAAEKVFISDGFQKANMDTIAKAANVSKRTVYNHFENKYELFQTILKKCCEEFKISIDIPYSPTQPLDEQLYEILSNQWRVYGSDRFVKLARVVIAEYISTSKFIETLIDEIQSQKTGIHRWLEAAINDNAIKPLCVEFGFEFLRGSIESFAHNPLLFDQPAPSKSEKDYILKEIIAMFLARYKTNT